MMEQITLGQIALAVTFIVGLITGLSYIYSKLRKWISNAFKEDLEPLSRKIDQLGERVDTVDMNACKNHLVTFLSGVEKGEVPDEIEMERFWEQYQHYTERGGNSYIKRKTEALKAAGKI